MVFFSWKCFCNIVKYHEKCMIIFCYLAHRFYSDRVKISLLTEISVFKDYRLVFVLFRLFHPFPCLILLDPVIQYCLSYRSNQISFSIPEPSDIEFRLSPQMWPDSPFLIPSIYITRLVEFDMLGTDLSMSVFP